MQLVIIDGQGGKMGSMLTEAVKKGAPQIEITAIGTNSAATAAMLKAGADHSATGENPTIVACGGADVIAGPMGIVLADALLGEITPAMAAAVGQSRAGKVLIPVSKCGCVVAGVREMPLGEYISLAARIIIEKASQTPHLTLL